MLAAYGVIRIAQGGWPVQGEVFNLYLVGLMTFILICSSATMAVAVSASRHGHGTAAVRFLLLTALGGLIFLGMQAFEWTRFIWEGARPSANPWGIPLFSATFFVITGFHGAHVTAGVAYLMVTAWREMRGVIRPESVEIAGLYWHFVDLVWVFIFTLLYLL